MYINIRILLAQPPAYRLHFLQRGLSYRKYVVTTIDQGILNVIVILAGLARMLTVVISPCCS
jgi:hypothetical protein